VLLGWRKVPVDPDGAGLGKAARRAMPTIEQLFIGAAPDIELDAFERKLYLIRKNATHLLRGNTSLVERKLFYVCSLSSKVIVYKGMLTPHQVFPFYRPDDLDYESHLAMLHRVSRPTRFRRGTAHSRTG
jgi:glutamate synthase (NADPH/NADH) large chain